MQSSISRPRRRAVVLVLSIGLVVAALTRFSPAQPVPRLKEPVPPIVPIEAGVAVLIVDPPSGGNVMDSDALLQRRINTHAATIGSEQHLRKVIAQPEGETRKTRWFKESDNPLERAQWLRDHLHVTVLPGTSLIQVSLPDLADAGERKVVLQAICQTYLDDRQFAANPGLRDRLNALDYVRIKAEASLKKLRSEMREKQPPEGRWPQMREVELSALIQQQTEAQQQAARALAAYNEAVANVRTDQIEQDKTNATLAADKARDIGNRVITLKEELEALQNLIANYETLRREEQGLVNQVVEVREQIKTATALQQSRADEIRWHLYPEVTPVR